MCVQRVAKKTKDERRQVWQVQGQEKTASPFSMMDKLVECGRKCLVYQSVDKRMEKRNTQVQTRWPKRTGGAQVWTGAISQ